MQNADGFEDIIDIPFFDTTHNLREGHKAFQNGEANKAVGILLTALTDTINEATERFDALGDRIEILEAENKDLKSQM